MHHDVRAVLQTATSAGQPVSPGACRRHRPAAGHRPPPRGRARPPPRGPRRTLVPQVEQRSRVVDTGGRDERYPRQSREQRHRQRTLVEGGEDHRAGIASPTKVPGQRRGSRPGQLPAADTRSTVRRRSAARRFRATVRRPHARPVRPAASSRSAVLANARMAGPVISTSPSLSSRTARTRFMRRHHLVRRPVQPALSWRTGWTGRDRSAPRSDRSPPARPRRSRRAGCRAVGTSTPTAPAAVAARTSAPMSPITAHWKARNAQLPAQPATPCRATAFGTTQRSASTCGQICHTSNGPSSLLDPLVHRHHLGVGQQSAADPGLVADHPDLRAPLRRRSSSSHLRTVDGPNLARITVVRLVVHEGPVAVEQHGARPEAAKAARFDRTGGAHGRGGRPRRTGSSGWSAAIRRSSAPKAGSPGRGPGSTRRQQELDGRRQASRAAKARPEPRAARQRDHRDAAAQMTDTRCQRKRPGGPACASSRHRRPCRLRISTSSACAGLHPDAHPIVGRANRMGCYPVPADQAPACLLDPKREVGVLPECPGEPLVEAVHRL